MSADLLGIVRGAAFGPGAAASIGVPGGVRFFSCSGVAADAAAGRRSERAPGQPGAPASVIAAEMRSELGRCRRAPGGPRALEQPRIETLARGALCHESIVSLRSLVEPTDRR